MYSRFEYLLEKNNCTAKKVSDATGIATSTFTDWKKGRYVPKADKMQKIADYFNVSVEYLMTGIETEKQSDSGKKYYFSDETAEVAQKLFENSDMRILFDAAKDSKPEDLKTAADFLRRLKETNPNG